MKGKIKNIAILVTILLLSACSNDFLEENTKLINTYNLDTPLFIGPSLGFTEVSVTLSELKNRDFKVIQYPKIIHFETLSGKIDETGKLSFTIKTDNFDSQVNLEPDELGTIVLNISDFGLLSIPVLHLNLGTPNAGILETSIDFGTTDQEKEFKITNYANGFLWFTLLEKPSWVTLKHPNISNDVLELDSVKMLYPDSYISYSVIPDIKNLAPGEHEGEIIIATSDEKLLKIDIKITVLSYENPESMIPIEGDLIDCEFEKESGFLFLLTRNPSTLISYNIKTKQKKELSLEKGPNCLTLSSDNTNIIVGLDERIETYSTSSLSKEESFDINHVVTDIVDGENGRYYFSIPNRDILSIDRATATIIDHIASTSLYRISGDVMLKIKNKPVIYLSSKNYSPNGIILTDISNPLQMNLVKSWHFGFGNHYWTTENQDYVFATDGLIYKLPVETTGEKINHVGKLYPFDNEGHYFWYFKWFDHNTTTSAIWASYDSMAWLGHNIVVEFNDENYDRLRTIQLNDYATTINEKKDFYKTMAHYVFSSENGDQLIIVKNTAEHDSKNWHFEILEL